MGKNRGKNPELEKIVVLNYISAFNCIKKHKKLGEKSLNGTFLGKFPDFLIKREKNGFHIFS